MTYFEALEGARSDSVEKGSDIEREAIARFEDFFSVFEEDRIREKAAGVYTEHAFFNDTLKTVRGAAAIEEYLVDSANSVESCTVEMLDTAESDGDYYFRWVMEITFKKFKKGETTRSIGMSHIRFDSRGKVVLHQDYWDAAGGFFEHVPGLGAMIRWIKGRL